jgi:hypothetical protein
VDAGFDAGPIVNACAAQSQAHCTLFEMCEPGTLNSVYGSVAFCETRLDESCFNSQNAPSTGQNTTNLQACTMAEQTEMCSSVLAGQTPPACEPPIGMMANGGACAFDGQCQSQFCNAPLNAICGTCAPQPTSGTTCSRTGCGLTLDCFTAGTTSVCLAPVSVGDSCDVMHPCPTGSSCAGTEDADGGLRNAKCVAFATSVGAQCSGDGHTHPACDHRLGLVCFGGTCEQASYADAGQPCGDVDGGAVICAVGTCQKATNQNEGVCQANAEDGASCDTANGPACSPPAVCVTSGTGTIGTCTVPNASSCP